MKVMFMIVMNLYDREFIIAIHVWFEQNWKNECSILIFGTKGKECSKF